MNASGKSTRSMWDEVNQAYTAKLIMTPRLSMTCWEFGSEKSAFLNLDGALIYDVIPVTQNGKIIGFMTKDRPFEIQTIEMGWFITSDTPISDLVNLFIETNKPAFFVFYRDEIVALLTPADLNKLPARTYIYSLIGDVELKLSELIRSDTSISRDDILNALSTERSSQLRENLDRLQNQNVDIDVIQLLYLSDMLTIVEKTPVLRQRLGFASRNEAEKGLSGINDLRSRTMHPVKPVLSKMPDDLISLKERLARIQSILILEQSRIANE